ncbi:MAG: hypothetical protein WAQ25_04330 [Candidatus Saccharimonas sp.]
MFGVDIAYLLTTAAVVLGGASAAAWWLKNKRDDRQITNAEFAVSTAAILLLIIPLSTWIGSKIAVDQAISGYREYYNGSLVSYHTETIACKRDGNCVHEYSCDPYIVMVPKTRTVSDGKKSRTETYYVPETRYHDCPYATQETTYTLKDTLGGTHVIGSHWLDQSPAEWRQGKSIPAGLPRGIPEQWTSARVNIDAGDPDGVTKLHEYDNYLLASDETVLKQYSDKVADYRARGLLPEFTKNQLTDPIYRFYQADKVVLVDLTVANAHAWQNAMARVNARFGSTRQGDLHMVAVPAEKISNAREYINTLVAYWQDAETYGKYALAKNAVVVVVGVDSSGTVAWSDAKTGIPEGNGAMLEALANLRGRTFEPKTLLGWPTYNTGTRQYVSSTGTIENIIIDQYPYLRPCMNCTDKGDQGTGYVYLKAAVKVPTGGKIAISIVIAVLSTLLFWVMAQYNFMAVLTRRGRNTVTRYRFNKKEK